MPAKTMLYFKKLVLMENFFCVSRPYLIEDQKVRLVSETIYIIVTIITMSIFIMDFITVEQNVGIRIFEIIIGIELFGLAFGSRFRNAFVSAMERLDENCGVDEEYALNIQAKTTIMLLLFLPSLILDFIGLMILGVNNIFSIFLCLAFAAHDAEMAFFALLVETMNMRLEKLKCASPNIGSRIYRHILIATAHISEQFTPRILLMLAVTLITTVAYELMLVLANSEVIVNLSVYLIWRESRSMYSLWMMCSAVTRSGSICNELALHLAGRLTQDQSISKENNPIKYKTVRRWYSILMSQRPKYISGSILSIGFSTPILAMDLSINYMLIIVQMYLAYK